MYHSLYSTYCTFELSALLQFSLTCLSLIIRPFGNVSIRWLIVVGDFLVRTNFHEYRDDKRGNNRCVIESTFTPEGQHD